MVLNSAVSRLTQQFADQILALYVTGSYADGTAVPNSDIDLVIVFKARVHNDEKRRVEDACKTLSNELCIHVDLEMLDEEQLKTTFDPILKLGSHLLFGSDIRERLPFLEIADWARDRLHTSYWRSINLFGRPSKIHLPLNYPAFEDPFLGYVVSGSTRTLLRHVSWAATALIAHQGQQYVVHKADFYGVYRSVIGDPFSDYLEHLYQKCKLEWNYQIPDNRGELNELCHETLVFENHFMTVYRSFLVNELRSVPLAAQLTAIALLVQFPLVDEEIKTALANFQNHPSVELRERSAAALEAINKA